MSEPQMDVDPQIVTRARKASIRAETAPAALASSGAYPLWWSVYQMQRPLLPHMRPRKTGRQALYASSSLAGYDTYDSVV